MLVPLLRQVRRPDLLPPLIDGLFYFPIETHSSHLDSSPLDPSTSDLSVTSSRCAVQEEVRFFTVPLIWFWPMVYCQNIQLCQQRSYYMLIFMECELSYGSAEISQKASYFQTGSMLSVIVTFSH